MLKGKFDILNVTLNIGSFVVFGHTAELFSRQCLRQPSEMIGADR